MKDLGFHEDSNPPLFKTTFSNVPDFSPSFNPHSEFSDIQTMSYNYANATATFDHLLHDTSNNSPATGFDFIEELILLPIASTPTTSTSLMSYWTDSINASDPLPVQSLSNTPPSTSRRGVGRGREAERA
ncbi:hypothetical protein HN873_035311 [Arachis hypogaea]